MPDVAEQLRGPTLRRIGALNTGSGQALDELTALAAQLCQVPMAMVILFDAERQSCASSFGPELQGTAPEESFCVRALGDAGVVVVPDATADSRFSSSPLVTGEPGVRFYAGAPLVTQEGNVLGALCVLDVAPRSLTAQHLAQLSVLARQVVSQLELHRQAEVLAMEVDARVAAEAALRKNQRLFDAVLENTDVMIYAKDLDGRFVLANPALHRGLSQPAGSLVGRSDSELFPEREAETFRVHDEDIVASRTRQVFVEDLSQTDGRVRRHHSTKFPLRDDEGRVYAIAGLSTDITALSEERKAHAASEQRWRDLVEQSSVAVAVIGADARFSYVNPQAVSMYGAEASEDLVGRLVFDFIPDGAEPNASSSFYRQLGDGLAVLGRRWTVRRLDGLRVTLEVNSTAIVYGGDPAVQVELRDVTAEVAAETALRAAHTELADRQTFTDAVLDSIEAGIIACDVEGRLTVSNRAARAWFAVDPDLVPPGPDEGEPGRHGAAMGPDGHSLSKAELPLNRALAEGSIEDVEIVVQRPGLPEVRLLCAGRALSAPDGRPLGAVLTMTDITVARAQTRALQASEQRFRTTFDNDPAGLVVLSSTGRVLQVNPALLCLIGLDEEDLLEQSSLVDLVPVENRDELRAFFAGALDNSGATVTAEYRLLRADGGALWALLTLTELPDPHEGTCLLLQFEDITDRKVAEQRLTRQAMHDNLTSLPNRAMLLDRTAAALVRLADRPDDGMVVMLFCDLDGFKRVNDMYGHEAGDHLLVEVARRLTEEVRRTDTVARLGGDEFVVLCENLPDHDELATVVRRIEAAIATPISYRGHELTLTASVGIAHASGALTAKELVRHADTAMYQAKRLGKNRYEVFDEDLRTRSSDRAKAENDLRTALGTAAVEVHYQPIFELPSRRLVAVEALARLRLPDGTMAMPNSFIPVAEETGLIVPLGTQVLRSACQQLARWRADLGREFKVAVNLSARQAARIDLGDVVRSALADADLPADALALELTESVLLDAATSTLSRLSELRRTGVDIGIDDFGTGYASLRYLRDLPITFLKVDRSFVAGMTEHRQDEIIVQAVIALATDLGLGCVVEGVETQAQLDRITGTGALVQGHLLGRPASVDQITALIGRSSYGWRGTARSDHPQDVDRQRYPDARRGVG